jgi:hypothetical protein
MHGPQNVKWYSCCFISMFNSKNNSCLRQEVNCNLILRASLTFTTQRVTELKKNTVTFEPCIHRICVSNLGRSLARVTRGFCVSSLSPSRQMSEYCIEQTTAASFQILSVQGPRIIYSLSPRSLSYSRRCKIKRKEKKSSYCICMLCIPVLLPESCFRCWDGEVR